MPLMSPREPLLVKIIVHGEIVFEGRTVDELESNPLVKSYYLGT